MFTTARNTKLHPISATNKKVSPSAPLLDRSHLFYYVKIRQFDFGTVEQQKSGG
jgi:hypothetical protein